MRHLWIGLAFFVIGAAGCGASASRDASPNTPDLPDAASETGPADPGQDESADSGEDADGSDLEGPNEEHDGWVSTPDAHEDEPWLFDDTALDAPDDPCPEASCDPVSDIPSATDTTAETAATPDPTPVAATTVVDAPGNTGTGFADANRAVNGVRGAGLHAGSMDVFSLGYQEGVNNYLVLSWGGAMVRNGPGVDFVVFENGFEVGSGSGTFFMDLMVVLLSRDGITWVAFPHDYLADDETVYVANPELWSGFAGRFPVKYNVDTNPVDPFDHDAAGGDPFDLDRMPLDGGEAQAIREGGFRYIKLVAAPTVVNPDTGAPFVRDPMSNGADIDGVIGRYVEE